MQPIPGYRRIAGDHAAPGMSMRRAHSAMRVRSNSRAAISMVHAERIFDIDHAQSKLGNIVATYELAK